MVNGDYLNPRDIDFYLYEFLDTEALLERPRYADHSREIFDATLNGAQDIAKKYFANHYAKGDDNEPTFDGLSVKMIPETQVAWDVAAEFGLMAAHHDASEGGLQLPEIICKAAGAYIQAANCASSGYYIVTASAGNLVRNFGSKRQKEHFLHPMMDGRFAGTMALSEPAQGSALADIKTSARLQSDGSYLIRGQKIYITNGDHNLTENIIHMVLAKIEGAPPGVRGISLFIVPKVLVNEDGSLGQRNDVALAGLLQEDVIYKDTIVKTSPGYIEYEGFLTSDFKDYGTLNLSDVISKSSNVAMVKLCDKSNSEEIIKNFYKWGFGKYINEIFISNREGYLPSSADLSAREKVSLCYGYGLQVTLIQLVGAYTALFSNGQFQGLNLISGSYNVNENEIISSEIAEEIKIMLSEAVNNGTGRNALVKNTRIIGKTGTTKRLTNQGYNEESFNASFIGMAELDDNDYVLGILVRDAKENGEGGGQVAAPIFSKIIKSIQNTL